MIDGLKSKSFDDCTFRISLPELAVFDGTVRVKFNFLPKVGVSVDVALDEIIISDKLNRKYDQYFEGICRPKENLQQNITADIRIEKKSFFKSDSTMAIFLLAGDGRKYEIGYSVKRDVGTVLEYVRWQELSADDARRLSESIKLANAADDSSGKRSDKNNGNLYDLHLVPQIPKIEEYKKAVLREKYYIQKEGGRKHKVTNGSLISTKQGLSTYSFEMEAELNLSDDASITLTVGDSEATGSVLVCEGFQILVIVDRDFGPSIEQAFIGVEPWKLLEALVRKLDNIRPSNRLAIKLIEDGPKLSTEDPAESIPKGQAAAISAARNNDITVIWGPPGTGKTYTMAEIAREALQNGKSILVVSHSNVSVDGVVKQTVDGLRKAGMENLLKKGKVLRYGYVRDEELSHDSDAVAYNYALKFRHDLKNRIACLRDEKEQLRKTGRGLSQKREEIERKLKKIRTEVRDGERQYVKEAQYVATTISKVTVDPLFDEKYYDIVMFDEVSMAYIPQIICAAMYAKEKLVLVGDFRQLSPIVQSEAKKVLEKDIFEYLGISSGTKIFAHPWLVMLNEQRRMHPDISAFPNRYIYKNLLTDHDSVKSNRAEIVSREPLPGSAMNLINLFGTYAAAMKNSDNSRFNILSAVIAFSTALQAEENGGKSIGIITPYAAQTRLIRAMIQDHRKKATTNIACSTVHQFQGSERDLIVFDAVESYPASKAGWLMSKDMDSVNRLINVALTRARGKLIVVANSKFWEMRFGETQHIFWKLIKHLTSNGKEISIKDKSLAPYIKKISSKKNLRYYSNLNDAIKDFKENVSKARKKIVISIPDGELDEKTQGTILGIIMDAKEKGLSILCKTNGYKKLPEGWKEIAWASENAIFPLIIIDDKVAWYGLPRSKGRFSDGNSDFFTVCHTVYSIRGEHTLEMIKAFSDFEYREVNGQRKPLREKNGNNSSSEQKAEDDGKDPAGIDAFVRKKERCPKCKSPMTVTRSMRGKVFLKCTSAACKEIAYLTPEITNWYIDREHVTCPIHHCGIQSGLGKYGIYVKCDRGHFLKPDEI